MAGIGQVIKGWDVGVEGNCLKYNYVFQCFGFI